MDDLLIKHFILSEERSVVFLKKVWQEGTRKAYILAGKRTWNFEDLRRQVWFRVFFFRKYVDFCLSTFARA